MAAESVIRCGSVRRRRMTCRQVRAICPAIAMPAGELVRSATTSIERGGDGELMFLS